jgi:hypothetical protein
MFSTAALPREMDGVRLSTHTANQNIRFDPEYAILPWFSLALVRLRAVGSLYLDKPAGVAFPSGRPLRSVYGNPASPFDR